MPPKKQSERRFQSKNNQDTKARITDINSYSSKRRFCSNRTLKNSYENLTKVFGFMKVN